MSCSIEESTTIKSELTNLQYQQPLNNNSHITNSLSPFPNNSQPLPATSTINLMTATEPNPKPSLLNIINTNNTQNTQNNNSQKIVNTGSLGNQLIITTVFQGNNSPQKLVTVSSHNNQNNNSNSAASSSVGSSASSSSSVGSSSPPPISGSVTNSSTNLTLLSTQQSATPILQAAINGNSGGQVPAGSSNIASSSSVSPPEAIRQTVSLTNDCGANNSASNLGYPIQQHQYGQFVESTGDNGPHGVSVFPSLTCSNNNMQQQQQQQNNNSYYSYQQHTPQNNYGQQNQQQQQNLLTTNMNLQQQAQPVTTTVSLHSPPTSTNLSNAMNNPDNFQQQQNQQQIYYMYQDASMDAKYSLDETTMEYEGHVSHTAQAAPITVQWLIDNFEPAEGCSLRRSTLYNYYLHHCTEQRLEPVNPASFGKLIRSVFLGLRTRRLGTRGNSKYHYYGIRVKAQSPLNQLSDDHTFAIRNHPMSLSPTGSPGPSQTGPSAHSPPNKPANSSKRAKASHNFSTPNASTFDNSQVNGQEYKPVINQENPPQQQQQPPLMTVIIGNNGNVVATSKSSNPQTTTIAKALKQNDNRSNLQQMPTIQQHQTLHGNNEMSKQQVDTVAQHNNVVQTQDNQQLVNSTVINGTELTEDELNRLFQSSGEHQLPNIGSINLDTIKLPSGCVIEDVRIFEELYKDQCLKILDLVVGLKLNEIENVWHMFWRSPHINHSFYEDKLNTQKFMALCECDEIIEFTKQGDYQFYQFCIEILIPDVLGPLPPTLVQSIRQLAKHMDSWLKNALVNVPENMRKSKMQIVNTFSITLRRYTSLNHLAQTVKNSLQNENILTQMLSDITKVDFSYIKEQAKWTCDCDEAMINRFEREFKESLSNYTSTMDNWITWLDTSVTIYLQQFESTERYAKMAKQFLLKWSFLCSSIIRDLTLRSAASFGSFHLIRLLYDEYMYYIIEHKIANEFNLTPLAVMSCEELQLMPGITTGINLSI